MLKLKLKWGAHLTPFLHVTELPSPKFFIRDFWYTLINKPLKKKIGK